MLPNGEELTLTALGTEQLFLRFVQCIFDTFVHFITSYKLEYLTRTMLSTIKEYMAVSALQKHK
jgi:hypothetical protein